MSSDVILFCEQLKLAVGNQDTKQASIYLDGIDQYFNDRISENEIDLAVERVFREDGGVLGFLKLCLGQCKVFKHENVKAFDLFNKIIELYPRKVTPYATNTVIICLQYIRSMQTTARESEKAVTVIETLVSENCCDSVDRRFLMSELLKIAQQSKAGNVQSRIFQLIGCLAKDYPDCIENDAGDGVEIRDMYFKALERAVINQQETALVSLTGAFNGLNDFLENFGPPEEHKADFAERLYKCIKPIAVPVETSQKAVNRSALTLLASRCELFCKQVFDDFFFWHGLLVNTWLKMDQYENRRVAILLLRNLHREVAVHLLQSSNSDRCEEILKFLHEYFKTILESSNSQPFEIRLAIVGFGLLAAPCKRLLSSVHLNELFNLVMQRTKSVANAVNQKNIDQLEHFPDYVEALSRIMEQVGQLSGVHLSTLQDIIITVIRNFHHIPSAIHEVTINTLLRSFHNLFELGNLILDDVLEKVVYQGVIWTCSHKLPFDANADWELNTDWKEQVTFHKYLPLWHGFLRIDTSVHNRVAIVAKIYDQMMATLFKILNKLDLSVRKRIYRDECGNDQELFFSDPNYDLEPVRVKDFHIFFNLVDFYLVILEHQSKNDDCRNFLKWINQLIEEVISKSQKYPMVSGFVGLMQVILRISNRINFFGNDLYEDNSTNYNNVYYYLSTIIRKVQQIDGEFQVVCLKLLFTTPTCMLQALIYDMIPVFQIAFDIGKSNASLFIAKMALNTVERYMALANRSSNETKMFLRSVLPHFDTYLQGFKNEAGQTMEGAGHRKKAIKRTAQKLIKVKESELLQFQKRIIIFLGTIEPEYCSYLVRDSEYAGLVKWSTSQMVRLTLYGQNFNPKIYMDALIPRISQIATTTTDRQKKVTACEIIQATILYLIGTNNHRGKLWTELVQLMLRLACDKDVSVQQMFEPLVMQTMHYLSRGDKLHHEGTDILIKCLMDAISHPTNLPVRDLASRSLREFLSWTFRQANPGQLAASPMNIDTLIHQLKMFNSDPLHQRRFGAALAFNNIYRVLREESSVLDKYWLDLMYEFCINFKLSEQKLEENSYSQTNLEQVSSSLDHILRVLRECKHTFNSPSPDRLKPTPFANSVLRDAVLWLFGECNSSQNLYRNKAMEMFLALAPCVAGFSSAAAFVRETQTTASIIILCENGIELPQIENADYETIYKWLRRLTTALDCYTWFIANNFVLEWKSVFESSKIFETLQYYINAIMNKNLFQGEFGMDSFTLIQKERINAEKSAIQISLLSFLNKTMAIECVPEAIWEQRELIWVVETSVFRPQCLECDTKNPKMLSNLPKLLETFIANINRYCSTEQFKNDINDQLVRSMIDIHKNFANSIEVMLVRCSISTSDINNLKGVDLVYSMIRAKHIPLNENHIETIDVLAKKVLYQVFDGIKEKQADVLFARSPSPDAIKLTSHMLGISFYKTDLYVNLIDLLLNSTELTFYGSLKPIKHGQHFTNLYKAVIYPFFLNNVDIIVDRLIAKIFPHNVLHILRMLIGIIDEAHKIGPKNINQMKCLTNVLLGKWTDILSKSNADQNDAITMVLIELVGQIAMICPYPLTEISSKAPGLESWLMDILNRQNADVEIKTRAIFLLPCLVGPKTYDHIELQNTLEKYQKANFPLCTEELRSIERASYENAFQAILDTMCASKSPAMLKFVINCTSPDANHIMHHKIIESVRKFMVTSESEHQLHCLNTVYGMFSSKSFDSGIRAVLMKRFLSQMILNSAKEVIIQFYAAHILKIEQLLESPYGLEMSKFRLEQAFTSRIGGFELLEILSAILTRDEICDTTCPIVIAKFGNEVKKGNEVRKGNELLTWMTQKASTTRTENFQTDNPEYMEWFRKYQCAAFKALCAIVSNTQTRLACYDTWIFIEKNWLNMINVIDSNLYLNQTLEVDRKPQIKERMISIRSKDSSSESSGSRKYIESQTVFESSLSQDVTKIDLGSSYVRTSEEVEQRNRLVNYQPKTLMLEQNSVNDHEVMATVCGVIEHMFENKITPINDDDTVRRNTKIKWIDHLCAMISGNAHINIRIFLVVVVDNCRHWFRNNIMSPAILKFLVDWVNLKGCIDALAIFLTVDLLEWDSMYRINTPDELQLASELIEILMKNAYSQHKDVFRRNSELIRNLVEKWREVIRLPYQLLYDKISEKDDESKANICGIHLNDIVLANGLVPWTEGNKRDFLCSIINCLNNTHTDVYRPAAEVLGKVLQVLIVKENNGRIGDYDENIKEIKKGLDRWKKSNEKKFMYVLYHINQNYVIDGYLSSILTSISSSSSDVKKFYLGMFLARVDESDPRDIEIVIFDLLNQTQEHQHQRTGLEIFNKALPKLSVNQIESLLPRVVSFQDSKRTELRALVYQIMRYIRDNYGTNEALNQKATDLLLNGLNDLDNDLQSSLFKYWSELPELLSPLNDRVLFMLRHLYSHDFLKYGVQLLIDLKSPDLKQKLLQNWAGDDDSKYTEYDINVHWKFQNSSLNVPMFTESQQKQIINGDIDPTHSYLKATPNTLLFDPTLDPSTIHKGSTSFSQNSLHADISSQMLPRRSQHISSDKTQSQTKFGYLRERIIRDSNAVKREMALGAVQRRNSRIVQGAQQQQKKSGQITLYRRYRFGDYPDFFINSLAFLMPLQVLVKLDAILARNTFVSVINAVYQELENDQKCSFLTKLAEIIEIILKQPDQCDPLLFSALTEIVLANTASLDIEPAIGVLNTNEMMIDTILLLENRLISSTEANEETWAQLAELYYNLSEYDVTASIFLNQIKTDQLLSTAIECESNRDYLNALISYTGFVNKSTDAAQMELFDNHVNDHCFKFSFNSIFNCFEVMGRWEDLERSVIDQLKDEDDDAINFEQLWTDGWNVKYLLPHYIRSEIRTLIYTEETNSTSKFIANIQGWLRNSDRAQIIKKHFGEQLMILHIASKDYRQAKVFSDQYFENFLDEWSTMSILSDKIRMNQLMNMRRVAEMHVYADILCAKIEDSVIAELCDRFRQTFINKADNTATWESLIPYRIFVTEHALDKFSSKTDPILVRLIESMFDMQFKLNEIAIEQHNIELSDSVLGRLNSFRHAYGNSTSKSVLQYELATIRRDQMKCIKCADANPETALQHFFEAWASLRQFQNCNDAVFDANPDIKLKVLDLFNEMTDHSREITSKCTTIDASMKQKIVELTDCVDGSQSVSQQIVTFSQQCHTETIAALEKCEQSLKGMFSSNFLVDEKEIGESYYRLAIFCLKQLNSGLITDQLETGKLLIKSVLRGMRHNSTNARLQFPRLLQLPNINANELTAIFNEEANQVPLWTFLGSISQIISRFDFEKTCFLDTLLVRMCTSYPSIIVYPFQLSYNNFRERKPKIQIRVLIRQILDIVKNPLIEQFIESMKCLSLPEKVLQHHLSNVINTSNPNANSQLELQECYDNVFGNAMRGRSVEKVLRFKDEMIELMKIDHTDHKKVKEAAKHLIEELKTIPKDKHIPKDQLNLFSWWLAQYHWHGSGDFIELPGQYTGNMPPDASTSIKIVKFNDSVSIIHSLRKPIKITAVCSDGQSYSFILKYGEDLRQDERIQHVQELMSSQMLLDKSCHQQKLSLRTYRVIPLNTTCGLISWIPNTDSIQSFLPKEKKWTDLNKDIREDFVNFLSRSSKNTKRAMPANVSAVLHYSPEEIARNFEKLRSKLPECAMRMALYELSASPECFFVLRNNFGKSLAAMSIAHWVLGIGDRNLGNFLIDKTNGKLIGIDFHMAFGAATRNLNIPELVPFRLTAQFVNVLKPLETSGFLIKSMNHVLRTFNMENESLMAALEVFIHEPTADYLTSDSFNRSSSSNQEMVDSSSEIRIWTPEQHLKTIKDKLAGKNPTDQIKNDLKGSFYSCEADIVSAYTNLIRGRSTTYRHQSKKSIMTVEEQVKCLIDIATDSSILGASFIGFQPWL